MARQGKTQEKKIKKKRKKKKKISKVFVSTAAFFSAAVVVVFCIYYAAVETEFFNLKSIDVKGNNYYDNNFILEKAQIEQGEKLYKIDRKKAKENIEKEIYVKKVRVVYELPDRIYIEVTEREEKYQVFYNNQYIVTDNEGVILNIYNDKNELLTIESLTNVIYNVGDKISFEGIENINTTFEALEYCNNQFGNDTINKLTVAGNNSIILDTEYGTKIKIDLEDDIKYQINFALKIITDRLNNNLTVNSDLIDFTKGDSPVYVEEYKMEEDIWEKYGIKQYYLL